MSTTNDTKRTASDILAEAKAILERGWCKGALEKDGSFCALGAVDMATVGSTSFDLTELSIDHPLFAPRTNATSTLRALAKELTGKASIADYNNDPSTTHQDVLNWFDKAIAQADEMGL
jgi:hypothetical protein